MQNPADFSKYNPNTRLQAEYFLQKYKDVFRWAGSEDILEVGCADGSITKEVLYPFAEKYLNSLVAVDVFAPAIEIANASNKNAKITFQPMDIGDEKQGDIHAEKFGKIFAFYCFHLVKPAESWSRNVYKMLKNGGQVFGTVVLSPNFHTVVIDEQLADTDAPWHKHIQNRPNILTFYGPKPIEAISKILTDAELVVDVINREEMRSTFGNKESLIRTFRSFNLFVKYVPDELKEDYLEDFFGRMLEYVKIDQEGQHYYTMEVVSFVATKP